MHDLFFLLVFKLTQFMYKKEYPVSIFFCNIKLNQTFNFLKSTVRFKNISRIKVSQINIMKLY